MAEIKITPELLAELKEKAEKATPGPWVLEIWSGQGTATHVKQGLTTGNGAHVASYVNGSCAEYIAAANPSVVLALISEIKRLRHKEDFYVKAMAEYHQVAKMAWDGEIPSPLPGHESSEEKMIEQFEYLNCPACGGSGHVGDCDEAIQKLKCDIEKLRKENEELHANNYGPEILNDPQALTASYFAGAMSEGRKRDAEIEILEKEADWLAKQLTKFDVIPCPEHPCSRSGKNGCLQCWREVARKAVKGKDNK